MTTLWLLKQHFLCQPITALDYMFHSMRAQQIMPIMQITVHFSCLATYIVIYCGLDHSSAIDAPPIPPIVGMAQTTYPDVLPNHQNTSYGIGLNV